MVRQTKTKIYKVGNKHTLYLKFDLITDSTFPFKPNEDLLISIEGNKLIIEKYVESTEK